MITLRRFFALRLRSIREQKGLTQEALAEAAGVSLNYVQALELERRSPSFDMVEKLAKGLRVDPRAFFTSPKVAA